MKKMISVSLILIALNGIARAQTSAYCSKYKIATRENRLLIDDHRSDSIDIINTTIDLDMRQIATSQISGWSLLSMTSKKAGVSSIRLDFEGLTVDSVVGGEVQAFIHNDSQLIIHFTNPLSLAQNVDVKVYYHGSPMMDASGWGGFYFTGGYAWNLGVGFADDPHSFGRIWFPCFDNFIERSSFEFFIHVNNDKRAACNGLLVETITNTDSSKTYHWHQEQSIPSYLACVAVGSYAAVRSEISAANGSLLAMHHAKASDTSNLKNSFIHLDDAVLGFEDAYGPYRFDRVGYSLVPFNSGAMEHATNIAYPISAANGSLASESLMAHELAHMWWGDNVTCQTDGDMWINEGWASFSAYLFQEIVYGRAAYEKALQEDLLYMLQFGHVREGGYRSVAGQSHEYVYGDHVYKKGALVAHNLRGYLGDEKFFDATAQFMEDFKYSSVSSDSLEKYFSQYTGVDLADFFHDWIYNPGYAVVVLDSFKASPIQTGYNVQLNLQQKLKGTQAFHTGVPVYFTAFGENGLKTDGKVVLTGQYGSIDVAIPFEPKYISLYNNHEQAQARTRDLLTVSSAGGHQLKNMNWNIDVSAVTDTAVIYFDHIWAAPDRIKSASTRPYRLSGYHYWEVGGLNLEGLEISAQYLYDGRTNSGNGSYLDVDLVSAQEDSLILLYRSSKSADWELYADYTKDMLGLNNNALGLILINKVLPGEYVLANADHSVLNSKQVEQKNRISVYPNPAKDKFLINSEGSGLEEYRFTIIDSTGRQIFEKQLQGERNEIQVESFSAGTYIYRIKSKTIQETGHLIITK